MTHISIFDINFIIEKYDALTEGYKNPLVILISQRDGVIDTGFLHLRLNFADVFSGEKGFITKSSVDGIRDINYRDHDTILIGCDAGMSRSPAVASAIARYIGDYQQSSDILTRYRFTNMDIYRFIMDNLIPEYGGLVG